MDKKRDVNPATRENNPERLDEKQSLKETAINKNAVDGKEVNPQLKQRQEKHQPRDKA